MLSQSRNNTMSRLVTLLVLCIPMSATLGFHLVAPLSSGRVQQQQQQWQRSSSSLYVATPVSMDEQKPHTNGQQPRGGIGKIVEIENRNEFEQFLAEDDRLCIVKFYASWCKSCQKMGMQFQRVANQVGDIEEEHGNGSIKQTGDLRFAAVEYATNLEMCKSFGIKKLPSVFIYSQGQLVDSFPCGPKKMPMLLEKLEQYHSMSKEQLQFEASMKSGTQLGEQVLEQVTHTTNNNQQNQQPSS